MDDCSSLTKIFSEMNYSENLSIISRIEQSMPKEIHPLPRSENALKRVITSRASLHFPTISVNVQVANNEDIDSVVLTAKNAKCSSDSMVAYLSELAKSFPSFCKDLFPTETAATGRAISELENLEMKRILQFIEKEIIYHQLQYFEKESKQKNSTQVFLENGDIAALFSRLLSCLREGSAILTCPVASPRVISAFKLAELFLKANPPQGMISFLPLSEPMCLPNISQVNCLDLNEQLFKADSSSPNGGHLYSSKGQSCAVVLDNADIDLAARACLDSMLYCSGMTFLSPHVALVQEPVFDVFRSSLNHLLEGVICQDPSNPNCRLGPFPTLEALNTLQQEINVSVQKDGAKIQPENRTNSLPVLGFHPSIILGVQTASKFFQTLPKGPYICLIPFRTLKEAVAVANRLGIERELLIVWTEVLSQALEAVSLFKYNHIGINCSSLDFEPISARLTRSIVILQSSDKPIEDKQISSESLVSAITTASKAQSNWAKQNPLQRAVSLQKAVSSLESMKDSNFLRDFQSRLVSLSGVSSSLVSRAGFQMIKSFQPKGVILIILSDNTVLDDKFFGFLYAALFAGNALVVTCSNINKETVSRWLAALTANGVNKDAVKFISGVLSQASLKSALDVRCVELVVGFGLNTSYANLLSLLFTAAAPSVFVDSSMDVFVKSVFWVEKMLHLVRQEKSILLSSGDIFAN